MIQLKIKAFLILSGSQI